MISSIPVNFDAYRMRAHPSGDTKMFRSTNVHIFEMIKSRSMTLSIAPQSHVTTPSRSACKLSSITVSSSPDTSSDEKSAAHFRRIFSSQVLFLLSLSGRSAVCDFVGFLCFLLLNTTNARCIRSSSSGESAPWHLSPFSVSIILSSRRSVSILVLNKSFCKFILWNKRSQGTDDSTSTR